MTATTADTTGSDPKTYQAMNTRESGKNGVLVRGTARQDTVERILRNDWTDAAVCREELSDDYKRDAARNFGKGSVSTEYILDKIDTVSPENCWVEKRADGREIITVYWGFQTYEVTLDTRQVTFDFGIDEDEADSDEADAESEFTEPAGTPGEVFEQLETGDSVIWDEKINNGTGNPLEVVVGYEKAKSAQPDGVGIEPTIYLEGPRGGTKILQRSETDPDTVTVTTQSLSSSHTTVSGLRVVSESDSDE